MSDFNTLNIKGALSVGGWQILSEQTLGSAATSVTVNCAGDTDVEYRVILRVVSNAATCNPAYRLNSDSGANYGWQVLRGVSTSVAAARATGQTQLYTTYQSVAANNLAMHDNIIQAKSGFLRTCITKSASKISGTTVTEAAVFGQSWSNTADAITSITIVDFNSNENAFNTGTYVLVLKRVISTGTANGYNSVSVPMGKLTADCWETIAEGTLIGDATTYNFTPLVGDTDVVYEIEASIVSSTASTVHSLTFNADGSSVYGTQRLSGISTTIAAARTATTSLALNGSSTTTGQALYKVLIYAKQGYVRTAIIDAATGIATTTVTSACLTGASYNVTNTQITSCLITSSGASDLRTGSYFRIKTLKRKV